MEANHDRDIPSTPVITLAGLTSLSDLLGELPLCESSIITSLHKSLLFHPRVAEEANNLLSTKDDALTRQLVQALEQTNSDQIELKPQYAGPASGSAGSSLNLSELPQLLQSIHTLKPTVFTSGTPQWQRQYLPNFPQAGSSPAAQTPPQSAAIGNNHLPHQPSSSAAAASASCSPSLAQHPQHPPFVNHVSTMKSTNSSPASSSNFSAPQHSPNVPSSPAAGSGSSRLPPQSPGASVQPTQRSITDMPLPIRDPSLPAVVVKTEPPTDYAYEAIATNSNHRTPQQSPLHSAPRSLPPARHNDHPAPRLSGGKHADLRGGPSPARASDAPVDANSALAAVAASAAGSSPTTRTSPAVLLRRPTSDGDASGTPMDTAMRDMFTLMKADERKATKRPNTVSVTDEEQIEKFSAPKLRRIVQKPPSNARTTKEDVTRSATYQQFMKTMEHELRRLEEVEQPNSTEDIDYHSDCIPSKVLAQLSNDVAKLRAKGAIDVISKSKLTLLINFAMRNVDVARNLSAGPDMDDDYVGEHMRKIVDAADACMLVSQIYATASKDTKFLQEDNMDRIVKFVQFQMRETIFPSYDPVFTVAAKHPKKSDGRGRGKKNAPASAGGGTGGQSRQVQQLYTRLVELTKIFVTLFDTCSFVDTIVLAVSTLAVEPFFVDNIETMQFACLELVTTIFRKENYVKYRSSILNDILASVDRLPCSKKNLRPYKLENNGGCIQMVTALVLQLIQCASVLPCSLNDSGPSKYRKKPPSTAPVDVEVTVERDLLIMDKYDTAFNIGGNFLTTFLNKCKSRSGETDFRPLFENFIYDLLTTVNKPEWPASELLLSLLGTLLVKYMSDMNMEQAIRVVSLEYLGIVAARLRKDTVESRCKVKTMDALIRCIRQEQEKEGDRENADKQIVIDPEEERTEFLQKILLDFLAVNAQEDNLIWDYARHFYLTQWYKDAIQRKKKIAEGEKGYASRKKSSKSKHRGKLSGSDSDDDDGDRSDGSDEDEDARRRNRTKPGLPDQELNLEIFRMLDGRKAFFLSKIRPFSGAGAGSGSVGLHHDSIVDMRTYIDYSNAHLIAQYLASRRAFSQSFDKYLQKIILVVREPSIAIRTKAMKCLAMIVEVDPSILKRKDMQMGVSQKLLDTSIMVREAAVDLVGKYVLTRPELIDQYYDMLSQRILDTGVSVRKRVIKILRDVCIEYPDFEKIPEICVKMIRRVNDEEGIQKLVTDVFMRMWFTPCADSDMKSIVRKINQMSDVVSMAHDSGINWLDGLLRSIFTAKEDNVLAERVPNAAKKEPPKEVIKACQQLADGLVNAILQLEGTDNDKVLNCVTTLNLLAKVRPLLLVKHAMTLEPYLNIKGSQTNVVQFISNVAEILQQVVPLMEHPSETFLADLEMHLMVLVCTQSQVIVTACLSCLGAVVNSITRNYKLIRDCFVKCYRPIRSSRTQLLSHPNFPVADIFQPTFRRGLFTIGLICRNFDFGSRVVCGERPDPSALPHTICADIFEHLLYFAQLAHNEIRREALTALGHFCIKNYEYLTNAQLQKFYCDVLRQDRYTTESKTTVLRNILSYLHDADQSMSVKDKDWQQQSLVENLCDMGDVMSGMASRIIQLYLAEVLECMMHDDYSVRLWALKLVELVLRQGLVHPVKLVPYLIGLSTDTRQEIGHRADRSLQEVEKQYPGYVNMKCHLGIQLSYELQRKLQAKEARKKPSETLVRGFCQKDADELPSAANGFLYTLMRSTKPQRRALVQSMIKQFDEQRSQMPQMLYLADNIAYFPYLVQDEPLYIFNQIDLFVSNNGSNLLQTFRECLRPRGGSAVATAQPPDERDATLDDEDDDEDMEAILARLPDDVTDLQKCILSAQGCILLLLLKQHLKVMYKITEGKIARYSQSESAKVYEKTMQRHAVAEFHPKSILDIIREQQQTASEAASADADRPPPVSDKQKEQLVERYLDFKQLMLKIDKEDSDNDSDRPLASMKSVPNTPSKAASTVGVAPSNNHNVDGSTGGTPTVHSVSQRVDDVPPTYGAPIVPHYGAPMVHHYGAAMAPNYGTAIAPHYGGGPIDANMATAYANHHVQYNQFHPNFQLQQPAAVASPQQGHNNHHNNHHLQPPQQLPNHNHQQQQAVHRNHGAPTNSSAGGQQRKPSLGSSSRKSSTTNSTPSRGKRKKRKVVSSSDDSDSDYA